MSLDSLAVVEPGGPPVGRVHGGQQVVGLEDELRVPGSGELLPGDRGDPVADPLPDDHVTLSGVHLGRDQSTIGYDVVAAVRQLGAGKQAAVEAAPGVVSQPIEDLHVVPQSAPLAPTERRHTHLVNENLRRWVGAALTATIIGMIALTVFSIAFRKGTDWWAAWGQWVGGVGSIVAAGAAVWIALRGWDLAAQEAREREASLIATWVEPGDDGTPVVAYINAGALPVHDVVVTAHLEGDTYQFDVGTLVPTGRPGSAEQEVTAALRRAVQESAIVQVGAESRYQTDNLDDPAPSHAIKVASRALTNSVQLETTFRRGKYQWRLDHEGHLTQL
ncbi:hypothetical protein [Amycolatopsis japonica]|uniref:hypothetical protein n=1 Tax=Amycolatopsis japonica TaxID=208439 RepID=UPI003408F786